VIRSRTLAEVFLDKEAEVFLDKLRMLEEEISLETGARSVFLEIPIPAKPLEDASGARSTWKEVFLVSPTLANSRSRAEEEDCSLDNEAEVFFPTLPAEEESSLETSPRSDFFDTLALAKPLEEIAGTRSAENEVFFVIPILAISRSRGSSNEVFLDAVELEVVGERPKIPEDIEAVEAKDRERSEGRRPKTLEIRGFLVSVSERSSPRTLLRSRLGGRRAGMPTEAEGRGMSIVELLEGASFVERLVGGVSLVEGLVGGVSLEQVSLEGLEGVLSDIALECSSAFCKIGKRGWYFRIYFDVEWMKKERKNVRREISVL